MYFYIKYTAKAMSNTDNLYPIDKSTLPTVRFDPSDSCYEQYFTDCKMSCNAGSA